MALTKKVIGLNSVDGARLLLDNEQALRSKDALGAAQDVLKVDAAGKLQLLIMPEVAADAASANQLVRKSQLDAEIASAAGDITALEAEFDAFVATKAQPNGLASLGADGKIPSAQVPAIAITDVFVVADIAARDALGGIEEGDVAKVTDAGAGLPKTYIHDGTQWIEIESGSDVDTVNGYTGTVVLATSDVAEGGATNLYYTPTRQAAIEAYADQAEADAISSANSYTDGEVALLEVEDLSFLKLDGSRAMTADLNLGNHSISNVDTVNFSGASYLSDSGLTFQSSASITFSDPASTITFPSGGAIDFGAAGPGVIAGLSEFVGGESNDYAAPKGYVDLETSSLLKLDGSRPMTGALDMGTFDITNAGSVSGTSLTFDGLASSSITSGGTVTLGGTAVVISDGSGGAGTLETNSGQVLAEAFTGVQFELSDAAGLQFNGANQIVEFSSGTKYKSDGVELAGASAAITGLVPFAGSETDDYAAPKGYVDSQKLAAEASAASYTDAQLDTLTVQELGYEAKTLSAGDVAARQITLAADVVGTPWVMLDNVLLKPVVDFTVSGAVISWPVDVPSLIGEELVAGDVLHVWYHKSAQPFV